MLTAQSSRVSQTQKIRSVALSFRRLGSELRLNTELLREGEGGGQILRTGGCQTCIAVERAPPDC